ncbi:MAG: hypothetical protein EPN43_04345 [Jatrophihabitans sp.]|nr:MAG: hypothetical protein EPN43_04345 [Jatrophihabitans sp.]
MTAELRKLAHRLGVAPDRLDFLAGVPAEDLRALRAQAGEMLFRADKHFFVRIAALTRAVPSVIAAKLAELTLPPLLAARTTELLDPAKAVDMCSRLPDGYLADVAAALEPSRCTGVLGTIPPARAAAIARVLAGRKEWVVIGGFVSCMSWEAVVASVEQLNGEQLLRIAFVLEDLARLDDITQVLTDGQLDEMVRACAQGRLWAELATVVANLRPERAARLGERLRAIAGALEAARQAVAAGTFPAPALARLTGA